MENNYVYPPDPVNEFDLNGMFRISLRFSIFSGASKPQVAKKVERGRQQVARNVSNWCGRGYAQQLSCDSAVVLVTRNPGGKNSIPLRHLQLSQAARKLGYNNYIPANKAPFNSHGQPVFQRGTRFITPDKDNHKGGVWKMFEQGNPRRLGTYDANLKRIGN